MRELHGTAHIHSVLRRRMEPPLTQGTGNQERRRLSLDITGEAARPTPAPLDNEVLSPFWWRNWC